MLNFLAWLFQSLPGACAISIGRLCGLIMYFVDGKHRNQVYQNIKTAFCSEKSRQEIRILTRRFFINLGANFVEFLRLPRLCPDDMQASLEINGVEHFEQAMAQKKGAVLMTIHFGNWELPMLAFCQFGYPENLIYKAQSGASGFNEFMLSSRSGAYERFKGITLFERGMGARKLFEALKRNEVIGMVIDQGGKEGTPVTFFGRTARFSTGGIRLAIKTGAAMCIGGLVRKSGLKHELMVHPFHPSLESHDEDQNVRMNLQRAVGIFEQLIREHPEQYMWMYKIWKSDLSCHIMILDDERVGHLRQSQAVARAVREETASRGGESCEKRILIRYRFQAGKYLLLVSAFMGRLLPRRVIMKILKISLDPESFDGLCRMKADVVISAGSLCAPVNTLIAREHEAKAVTLLRPSMLPLSRFDAVVLPEHDVLVKAMVGKNVVLTKGAPNLVDEKYLNDQAALLMQRYSHLKLRNKFVIGVLLGGDTKSYILDESVARILANQIKEAAEQLDADIMITTSRRTSDKVENVFYREFKKYARCQLLVIANRNNVNEAVGGILGLADVVVVSGDSISMVSEAASSGKRTVVFPVKRREGAKEDYKHNRFVDRMNKEGYILSSEPRMIGQSIFHLAKNKLSTRKLDDAATIRQCISRIL
jgi:lauroyl/myristoyl acyltransferase